MDCQIQECNIRSTVVVVIYKKSSLPVHLYWSYFGVVVCCGWEWCCGVGMGCCGVGVGGVGMGCYGVGWSRFVIGLHLGKSERRV